MNKNPVLATIKTKFDLGYIVMLESGEEAQLRVFEQKGRELKCHIAGTEESIYGEMIPVYVTYRDKRCCSVSQLSPCERKEREEIEKRKTVARECCEIGSIYSMGIEKDYEWGYLCSQVDGYLSGVIKKPTQKLDIGQEVRVVVVAKNKQGAPYFDIQDESNQA